MPTERNLIKEIILNGSPKEKQKLFSFSLDDDNRKILFKFNLWANVNFPRFFESDPCEEHDVLLENILDSYRGVSKLEIGFRGFAKTTYGKLFIAFVILNDTGHHRKYIKYLCKDISNAKQAVTDIYNLMVETKDTYGDMFEQNKDIKREETMNAFTTKDGVKLSASQIGKTQRGNVQDAYRPDWLIFDDVEDSESITSIVQTESIINKVDEAIQGLSIDGSFLLLGNYISDGGVVQYFINTGADKHIVPIVDTQGNSTWHQRFSPEKIEELKSKAKDWAGDYLCLKPDTEILTPKGFKRISTLKVGDVVISHKLQEQKILQVFESNADELIDITVNGEKVTITKNHPVLTIRNEKEEWIPAGELTEDDLVVVNPHGKLWQ